MEVHDLEPKNICRERDSNRLLIAMVITGIIFVAEIVGGVLSNSLALISDAFHMLTDTSALLVALIAAYFATLPATGEKTYGYYRLEILAAFVNASFLLFIAAVIFYKAIIRLLNPEPVAANMMLIVAIIGLVANVLCMVVLYKGRENLNLKGAFIHVFADALDSIGVIIGAIIISFTGWVIIDAILSIIIALVIFITSLGLLLSSVHILLEGTPRDVQFVKVLKAIRQIANVRQVHDLHIWSLTSDVKALSAHIVIERDPAIDSNRLINEINELLEKQFGINHTTIQIEFLPTNNLNCRTHPEVL